MSKSNLPIPVTLSKLVSLSETEREAIRVALEEYVQRNGERQSWAQKAILEGMLPMMFWGTI